MDNEKKQLYTRRIAEANSTEMVIIIYDIALDRIDEAKAALSSENPDADAFCEAVARLQGCIAELENSLNFNYELAARLRTLYGYCLRKISVSQIKQDASVLDDVVRVLKPLRDAYNEIKGENKNGPVMDNSPTVFAGLTYGREELIESLSTSANRGYLA